MENDYNNYTIAIGKIVENSNSENFQSMLENFYKSIDSIDNENLLNRII